VASQTPERRSYHSTFVYDNRMYVMGGLDIQNGSMATLWELDFGSSLDLDNDERLRPGNWKMIPT
jgi:hypothetical protein